ncbi:MAG: Gfo/Idh/MocA family oxidoreductase [Bacteroidales bacterium]|jgi:predicted dehydrogenase|nr:Gfo/Idh/MocA family oxidoreductase [Bacteroidales bacterium]
MKKIWRFLLIYGVFRTLIKIAGRTRYVALKIFFRNFYVKKYKEISLIGCGQFGFTTMSYYLQKRWRKGGFLDCFDVDRRAAKTTAAFWGYNMIENVSDLINNPQCKIIYIASNHYTHTPYAIQALKAGKTVYVEKPIAVTIEQFNNLLKTINNPSFSHIPIYVGYNRPFSKAIRQVTKYLLNINKPITLNCFISGHKIAPDHWYRDAKEGTRICGNVGHWIDLSIHLFNKRGAIPYNYEISIVTNNDDEPDDNLSIVYKTEFNDLVTIVLTSRDEPFEGINETINLQCDNIISKIDDFRRQQIWIGDKMFRYKYFPKDCGHKRAILQPFMSNNRECKEWIYSTYLMLKIKEMVLNHETHSSYNMLDHLDKTFIGC